MNKDTFVPIGDEFINSIINSFRNNQNEKSSDDWFNNDQTFYEQLKRKYKYTTEDKKGMMFDIIVKEIKKEKNISEDEATKIANKILEINQLILVNLFNIQYFAIYKERKITCP